MCMLCVEWEKGKMTSKEVRRALFEMIRLDGESNEHVYELYEKLDKEEQEKKGV